MLGYKYSKFSSFIETLGSNLRYINDMQIITMNLSFKLKQSIFRKTLLKIFLAFKIQPNQSWEQVFYRIFAKFYILNDVLVILKTRQWNFFTTWRLSLAIFSWQFSPLQTIFMLAVPWCLWLWIYMRGSSNQGKD